MTIQTHSQDERLKWLINNDEEISPEEEARIHIEEMRKDVTIHLTTPVLQYLIGSNLSELSDLAQALMPHLVRCVHCRLTLRQTFDLDRTQQDHPAAILLKDADEWARWQEAANTATKAAHHALLEQGIGYVYERDGIVYRRLPDGHEERITPPEASAS